MIIREHCQPGSWRNKEGWLPKCEWPEKCTVQWGDKHQNEWFWEAFPINPQTFIRGEGPTLEAAELDAWNQLQKYMACPGHEFERRGYTNGAGFCKHCNMFQSHVFEPDQPCVNCGDKNGYGYDNQNRWWCKDCWHKMPKELWNRLRLDEENYKERQRTAGPYIELNLEEIPVASVCAQYTLACIQAGAKRGRVAEIIEESLEQLNELLTMLVEANLNLPYLFACRLLKCLNHCSRGHVTDYKHEEWESKQTILNFSEKVIKLQARINDHVEKEHERHNAEFREALSYCILELSKAKI